MTGEEPAPAIPAPLADYELKVPGWDHPGVATAMAGAIGTLVVFAVGWAMARVLPRVLPKPKPEGAALDAA